MKVQVKLYATLATCLPSGTKGNAVAVDIGDDDNITAILERFQVPPRMTKLVLVNGVFVPPEERGTRRLQEGDHLAVWPPVAGG